MDTCKIHTISGIMDPGGIKMNLLYLSYFMEIAKREHLTQAADELHITQPALSRALSKLEQELGVKLFERDKKKLRLNENGRILQQAAEKIFAELDELQVQLSDAGEGVRGKLCIGSSFPERDPDFVQQCILEFMQNYPDVSVDYMQIPPLQLARALDERRIDVAISSLPLVYDDIEWYEVFTEKLGVLMAADHPLAAEKEIHVAQLRNERFFCNNMNTDTRDLTVEFCHRAGFEPEIFFQGFFARLIGKLVSEGKGVSFLVENRYRHDQRQSVAYPWSKNLVFRPVAEEYCRRSCGIAYSKKTYHSKAMLLFRDYFLDYVTDAYRESQAEPEEA